MSIRYTAIPTARRSLILFIGLLSLYALPGAFGHTPWKQDEAYSFGIIQSMYESADWLVPTNAGEPFMEKPPLFYWVATLGAHLLDGVMPLHEAARSATLLFCVINLCFFALLARRCSDASHLGDRHVWLALALYAGAPGVLKHSHDLFTDTALMAGATVGLYGIQGLVRQQRIAWSALWLAVGTAMSLLSKGLFVPGLLWIALCLAPAFLPNCRSARFWIPATLAGVLALLLSLPWPLLLYLKHPALFDVWFWDNNVGRFIGYSVDKLGARGNATRIPEAVIWFAFPSGLLATAYILMNPWKRLRDPDDYLLVSVAVLGVVLLQLSATGRALYLLPLVAPMALLAARMLEHIPERALATFASGAALLWSTVLLLLWGGYLLALSPYGAELLDHWLDGYRMQFSAASVLAAAAVTAFWCARNRIPLTTGAARATRNWALGLVAAWSLLLTLYLGWLDYSKGYERTFTDLRQHLDGHYQETDCMASYNLGESEAPLLYYFAGILHQVQPRFEKPSHCRWLIARSFDLTPAPAGMRLFWNNHRPGEFDSNFIVYASEAHDSPTAGTEANRIPIGGQ